MSVLMRMVYLHWNNIRITGFLELNSGLMRSYPVVVLSCIDGDPDVADVPFFTDIQTHRCMKYMCFDGAEVLAMAAEEKMFYGYDELWFGSKSPESEIPYPALIGPCDREEYLPVGFEKWFEDSGFDFGIGDGHEGLNLVCRTETLGRIRGPG